MGDLLEAMDNRISKSDVIGTKRAAPLRGIASPGANGPGSSPGSAA